MFDIATLITVVTSIAMLAYWLGKKFTEINGRFRSIDERFKSIDERFRRLELTVRSVIEFIRALHTNLIDFMSMKGILTREERDYLVKETERLSHAYLVKVNPLKPEEARFILEVMKEIKEKDPKEIDLSKLDKILEIADRWFWEDGSYEAAKLWIMVYTLKRILEKERGEL